MVLSDAKGVIDSLSQGQEVEWSVKHLQEEINELKLFFESTTFVYIPREQNSYTHKLISL
uniref:RNase H type-1 domain-containing protein n=1 Tax=Nelumbo nucifera TaxID=4432 RepID=A0A822Z8Z4_NELNU|nr:TPA_asm: hypothetical protein HUJ06_015376 [Nelumbo nucifera]